MNTSTVETIATAPPSMPPTLEMIRTDLLRASANNPRRTFDEAGLEDLKNSIAQLGIQEPLLVRSVNMDEFVEGADLVFEIVSGHRRHRAALALGLKEVPCLVRDGMTDEEAREAAIVANLQRVDIHPVEEAEAFQELLEVLGSIPAVAARMGKEQAYVAKCLRLTALTVPSRDAMRGGLITIEHALLLARLAETEQNAALKWTLDRNAGSKTSVDKVVADRLARRAKEEADKNDAEPGERRFRGYIWEPQTVVQLKAWIEAESGILLSRAPWSLTDEDYLLPDVGPCSECPKNTMANSPLFGDLEMGQATCTDGACFAAKTSSFVQIAMSKAGHNDQAKPKVLVPRLSWKSTNVKPSLVPNDVAFNLKVLPGETANPAKVLKYGQWLDVKAGSCPNVRPGITMDWSDAGDRGYMGSRQKLRMPGETLNVCIVAGCKVHPKAWEKQQAVAADKPKPSETPEQRAAREAEAKAYRDAERPVRVDFMKLLLAKAMEKRENIVRQLVEDAMEQCWDIEDADLASALGILFTAPKNADEHATNRAASAAIEKYIDTAPVDDLIRVGAALQHSELLTIEGPGRKDAERKAMEAAAKKLGFKWAEPSVAPAKVAAPKKVVKAPAKKAGKAVAKKAAKKAVKK